MEPALVLLVVVAAAWPIARLCLSPSYRRAQPAVSLVLALLTLAWAGVGVAAALASPVTALAMAALAATVLAARWWRARPSWGRARGLPPGSLTLGPPIGAFRDASFYLEQARLHGPIFKTGGFRRGQACVVGLAAGLELLRAHEADLAAPALPFSRLIPRGFLRYMTNADHDEYRRILRAAFTREVVAANRAMMTAAARRHLERLAGDGAAAARPEGALTAMAFEVLIRLVYGLAADDPACERIGQLYESLDHRRGHGSGMAATRRALAVLGEELRALGRDAVRRAPASALAAVVRADAQALADPTVVGNLVFIPRVAANDLGDGLVWVMYMLARDPAWLEGVRTAAAPPDDLDSAGTDDLATRIVMETLRMQQSEYLVRRATADIAFRGFVIPRGWLVRVCVYESHRDPAVFRDPDAFDPDRFLARTYARSEYAPLGGDRHACLGEHLIRALGRVMVRELARGFDLALADDGAPELGPLHWRPSRRFRVRLAPRQGGGR
jgi:cytochrome P450